VSRDGGPKVYKELKEHMKRKIGINLGGFQVTPEVSLREDGDTIIIDGQVLKRLFVEKLVSGEDHNAYVYFRGGGRSPTLAGADRRWTRYRGRHR
jgi:inositol hexakisphosphate/diphosphoinositol-pentakisphosphate kinase